MASLFLSGCSATLSQDPPDAFQWKGYPAIDIQPVAHEPSNNTTYARELYHLLCHNLSPVFWKKPPLYRLATRLTCEKKTTNLKNTNERHHMTYRGHFKLISCATSHTVFEKDVEVSNTCELPFPQEQETSMEKACATWMFQEIAHKIFLEMIVYFSQKTSLPSPEQPLKTPEN